MDSVPSAAPSRAPTVINTGSVPSQRSSNQPPARKTSTPAANTHPRPENRYTSVKFDRRPVLFAIRPPEVNCL